MDVPLYFEDYYEGLSLRTADREVADEDLARFVALTGFNEGLFVSAKVAEESIFGRRIVPGALTFCLAEGLVMGMGLLEGAGLAFLGVDGMRIPEPTHPGDTIHVRVKFRSKRLSKSRRDAGIVVTHHEVCDEGGAIVMTYEVTRLIRQRQANGGVVRNDK